MNMAIARKAKKITNAQIPDFLSDCQNLSAIAKKKSGILISV